MRRRSGFTADLYDARSFGCAFLFCFFKIRFSIFRYTFLCQNSTDSSTSWSYLKAKFMNFQMNTLKFLFRALFLSNLIMSKLRQKKIFDVLSFDSNCGKIKTQLKISLNSHISTLNKLYCKWSCISVSQLQVKIMVPKNLKNLHILTAWGHSYRTYLITSSHVSRSLNLYLPSTLYPIKID